MRSVSPAVQTFWAAAVDRAEPGALITEIEPLLSGNYARSWKIRLDRPPHVLVGRRLPPRSATSVLTLQRLLDRCLEQHVPAPRSLWVRGVPGRGVQSQLLTWVEGTTVPPQPDVEIPGLVNVIEAIGRVQPDGLSLPSFPAVPSLRWQERIRQSALGRRLLDRLLGTPEPLMGSALVHGDLGLGNLVWCGQAVAGVIDWDRASLGTPAIDIALVWTDLVTRRGPAVAASFLDVCLPRVGPHDDLGYWMLRMVVSTVPRVANDDQRRKWLETALADVVA